MSRVLYFSFLTCIVLISSCDSELDPVIIDTQEEWLQNSSVSDYVSIEKSPDQNGVIDLMGNGGLMLAKKDKETVNRPNHFNLFK